MKTQHYHTCKHDGQTAWTECLDRGFHECACGAVLHNGANAWAAPATPPRETSDSPPVDSVAAESVMEYGRKLGSEFLDLQRKLTEARKQRDDFAVALQGIHDIARMAASVDFEETLAEIERRCDEALEKSQ